MAPSPITTVADLRAALDTPEPPRLLDIRWHLGGPQGRPEYDAGHIPGAVFVDLETVFSGHDGDQGGGRHPLPDAAALQAGLRAAGVRADQPVVCYDAGDTLPAARAWWVLRWAGLTAVTVLDGGWAAWTAAGGPVSTDEPQVEPSDITVSTGAMPLVDADGAVQAELLMDVRAHNRYTGEVEPFDRVGGHIPGAVNVPGGADFDAAGLLLPPDQLAKRYADAGVDGDREVVVSCGSGITAARTILAIEAAGLPVRTPALYVGSYSDWSSDPSRPIATGDQPGR
jgi:thiosulfate/3-mercaptopyruvate sulfurtransferase